ncbi:hypothetical protein CK203_099440 [Vitis vinifera]|uniref:Uncharacterized protein n=1 Tax=Vitis vinifera TaxID=29760 RepID=A0A438BN86_VITVI|nr:hypothetical protein CK203_099440 [Vitis vinifera]
MVSWSQTHSRGPAHSYEPARPEDYRVWAHPSQSDMVHILSRGHPHAISIEEGAPPSMISEGFFFGPHHLIMAALLYFEEKVHRKKLLRADAIPLLFPRLLCQILEHLGYPSEPQLERRRICREIFTLDKWTSMTAYDAEPGAPAGPEHPEIHTRASRGATADSASCTSYIEPHPSESRSPYPFQKPTDPSRPSSSRADYAPEETTTGEIEASIPSIQTSTAEPSSPHDPPTTI